MVSFEWCGFEWLFMFIFVCLFDEALFWRITKLSRNGLLLPLLCAPSRVQAVLLSGKRSCCRTCCVLPEVVGWMLVASQRKCWLSCYQ